MIHQSSLPLTAVHLSLDCVLLKAPTCSVYWWGFALLYLACVTVWGLASRHAQQCTFYLRSATRQRCKLSVLLPWDLQWNTCTLWWCYWLCLDTVPTERSRSAGFTHMAASTHATCMNSTCMNSVNSTSCLVGPSCPQNVEYILIDWLEKAALQDCKPAALWCSHVIQYDNAAVLYLMYTFSYCYWNLSTEPNGPIQKDSAFRRHFNAKPSIILGCPGVKNKEKRKDYAFLFSLFLILLPSATVTGICQ